MAIWHHLISNSNGTKRAWKSSFGEFSPLAAEKSKLEVGPRIAAKIYTTKGIDLELTPASIL
ncbi:hypothetical protein [Caldanaerobius polysaccharolyticus]|uniref:hypothetical protein n=1 Tax=Caldanaerobius polysaccharolyticus TaxID=44256 RepID=UPI0012EC819F|nr:hypothetical protein [Caldanaerobius polysaccharolyticus]